MNAKERKAEEKKLIAMRTACAVWGKATVRNPDGTVHERPVRLWESLPRWWNQAESDQRREWLIAFFRRALGLAPEEELVTVIAGDIR